MQVNLIAHGLEACYMYMYTPYVTAYKIDNVILDWEFLKITRIDITCKHTCTCSLHIPSSGWVMKSSQHHKQQRMTLWLLKTDSPFTASNEWHQWQQNPDKRHYRMHTAHDVACSMWTHVPCTCTCTICAHMFCTTYMYVHYMNQTSNKLYCVYVQCTWYALRKHALYTMFKLRSFWHFWGINWALLGVYTYMYMYMYMYVYICIHNPLILCTCTLHMYTCTIYMWTYMYINITLVCTCYSVSWTRLTGLRTCLHLYM